ncbi:MAG: hypothetical protein HY255_08935 [Betaproteobacteria bacterium]|nr:hypothetical protein [Betaproteobacteria bacterium]
MNQIEVPQEVEQEPAQEPTGEESRPSMEQTIADTWKEIAGREAGEDEPRDGEGRFVKRVGEKETGETGDGAAGDEAEDTASEAPAVERRVPNTWRKTAATEWAQLSPVVQDEILKRENDVRQGIDQYREAASRATQFDKVVAPYMATIKSFGIDPHVAIGELLAADHRLRYGSPQEKAHYFSHLAQSYGVDVNHLKLPQAPQIDPHVSALMQEVNTLKSQQARVEQHRQAQVENSLNGEIASFARDREHFADVAEDMAALIQIGRADGLPDAYEKACRMSDRVQQSLQAKRLADQRAQAMRKAKEARNAAATNVRTRGTLPARAPLGSMEDTIRAEAKRLGF